MFKKLASFFLFFVFIAIFGYIVISVLTPNDVVNLDDAGDGKANIFEIIVDVIAALSGVTITIVIVAKPPSNRHSDGTGREFWLGDRL